jgi:L-threonylcarbamoyladenylate synthase
VAEAALLLQQGEVVAFPTETVYGLGADAGSDEAVAKIFAAKGRPSDNPLIVHLADAAQLAQVVEGQPGAIDQALMTAFWPGPLTLVLPARRDALSPRVTAGLATVAVRVPDHPLALALLRACGRPLAAPSANRSGRPSPTRATHVAADLDGRIAAILDGGPTGVGLESTVVQVVYGDAATTVHILRPGGITAAQLRSVLPDEVAIAIADQPVDAHEAPRAPGMKYAHYAPKGEMTVVQAPTPAQAAQWIASQLTDATQTYGILTYEDNTSHYTALLENADAKITLITCGTRSNPASVAQNLYSALRQFDDFGATRIFAEAYPVADGGLGQAVMNRLLKAAGNHVVTIDN